MASTIPVPIQFSLPEGWQSVPPDEVGAPGAAFVALKASSARDGFTPNISITGEVQENAILTEIADEAVEKLRAAGAADVRLGRRNEVGSDSDPAVTQAVKLTIPLRGKPADLVQFQVFMLMRDQRDPQRSAVLHVVLSALLEDQFEHVIGDFQKFLATIEPEKPTR